MSHHINIVRLKAIYNLLSPLEQDFVFVGGAVVSLYADVVAEEVRPTDDVDVLVEIYTRPDYIRMEEKLRGLGFRNDTTAKFVGRYLYEGLVVDFMPMGEEVLGFSNRWYKEGFNNAMSVELDEHVTIKVFNTPYFLASKIEAFKSRGKNESGSYDGRVSTDFEDIVFLLQNRRAIWEEIDQSSDQLKEYLTDSFTWFIQHPDFEEWVDAHVGFSSSAAGDIILPQIKTFLAKDI